MGAAGQRCTTGTGPSLLLLGLLLAGGAAAAAAAVPHARGSGTVHQLQEPRQADSGSAGRRLRQVPEPRGSSRGQAAAQPARAAGNDADASDATAGPVPQTVVIVDNTRDGSSGSRSPGEVIVVPISPQAPAAAGGPATAVPIVTTQTRQVNPASGPGGAATETISQTQVLVAPGDAQQVLVPVPAGAGTVGQVVVLPGSRQQAPQDITLVPTRPDQTAMPSAVDIAAQQQGLAYCIPRSAAGLAVLAAGDSITQGSVPSKNLNHPYTIRMKQLLEAQLSAPVRAVDAGLGGGGVFMTGFNVPTTFGPWLDSQMALGPWNVAVVMIGINDLLRGGHSADAIMTNLKPMLAKVLAARTPLILIPPFAAPGFVQQGDSKEAERRKLAGLFRAYAGGHAAATRGMGPQVWVMDLQASPFEFYGMSPAERAKWLDDGLHMTVAAYDAVGALVAKEILSHMCTPPVQAASNSQ